MHRATSIKSKNVAGRTSGCRRASWHPRSAIGGAALSHAAQIDAVYEDTHPVFVQTVGHFAMANAKALELGGVARTTPDPGGRRDFADANGDATGLLEETAIDLVEHKISPGRTFEQVVAQLVTAQRIYNRSGQHGEHESTRRCPKTNASAF